MIPIKTWRVLDNKFYLPLYDCWKQFQTPHSWSKKYNRCLLCGISEQGGGHFLGNCCKIVKAKTCYACDIEVVWTEINALAPLKGEEE